MKINYDFIEIGTSDFDTLIELSDDSTVGLTIEPLGFYLDKLPNKQNVKKLQVAISDKDSEIDIYYIPENEINNHSLPWWVRGSNSVGKPHSFTVKEIGKELYDELVTIEKVPTITWNTLVESEKIGSISYLKVDTEGYDHIIIQDYLNMCENNPELYAEKIKFERHPEVSNIQKIDELIGKFKDYYCEINGTDVILTKVKIPRIIHQTFRTNQLPQPIQEVVDNLKLMNPEFEYRFYNDEDCYNFVKNNYDEETLDLYSTINPKYGSCKADFFRYLLMYKVGGVYLDIKSSTTAPLKNTILPTDEFILSHWSGRDWSMELNYEHGEFQNWHIICIPNHPFLRDTIERVKKNLRNYNGGVGKLTVIHTTGPIPYSQSILSLLDNHKTYRIDSPVREFRTENEINLCYRKTVLHQDKLYGFNISNEEPIILNYQEKRKGVYYKNIKIADEGYLINLPQRTDRKESVLNLFNKLQISGFELVDGVVMDEPEFKKLGCTQAYLNIFQKFLNSNSENIIVFEDDLKLMDGVDEEMLDKIFNNWDDTTSRYDVVALGVKLLPRSRILQQSPTDGLFKEMLCSQSLYYKRHFVEHYVSQMKDYLNPDHYLYKCTIDMFLNDSSNDEFRFIHHKNHRSFKFGITIPMVFTQTPSFSDNEMESQNYDKIMELSFWRSLLPSKAFVYLADEKYFEIVQASCRSVREFSSHPIFVYLINSDKQIDVENVKTINWKLSVPRSDDSMYKTDGDNFYIDRANSTIYRILIQRINVVRHALENYASTVAYLDSDSVATPEVDSIFDMYDSEKKFPYFVEGIYDWMHYEGRGGAETFDDLSSTLEHPACDLFNINQYVRGAYRQTGYFVAGQNSKEFLEEWYWYCTHPKVLQNTSWYAAYNEETIMNVVLYKNKINEGLPYIYVNGSVDLVDKMYTEVEYKGSGIKNYIGSWLRAPDYKKHLLFFHGEKNPEKMMQIVERIKSHYSNKKLKVLYVAPHLSTGGMPGFLLKKIEVMKRYCPDVEIYVVEFGNYGEAYVVQKNRIKEIVDKNKFWTLGHNKMELINIIKDNSIDVVHVEEMIEGFDTFNQMPPEVMCKLYSNQRTWKVVETCHNVWFNHEESKIFYPEAFAFCTPYHKDVTFKTVPSYGEVIQFPIEKKIYSEEERVAARKELGFGKDKIHVINVGLWTKGKNQGEGVEIARLLKKSNPEIVFHFIGNQAQNFKDYWGPIMKNIPMNVKVWGERSDIDTFMKAADVFMFNSTWECNPLVLREAISYGLKILCRNLPQYLDMFTQYITPIDDNIETTKNTLLELIDKDLKFEVPTGQEKIFAESHLELYNKVLNIPIREQHYRDKLEVVQYFINQPFLEIKGRSLNKFKLQFTDESGQVYYEDILPINSWIKLNRQYFTRWTAKIWENDSLIYEKTLNYENQRVYISFDSKSLGDTVSWIPYVLEFQKIHKCKVVVSTFWNHLFQPVYPELEFVLPGTIVNNIHGMYKLGWFDNLDMQPRAPKTIPLQQTASDILGLEFQEIRPRIHYEIKERPYKEKYITIATNSTAGCKFWTREGWQELINYFTRLGYRVVNVSKENNPFENQTRITDISIENTMNVIHHSEFFIGLSSGLSWLAWAMGKHVVMISNFTTPDHEFQSNCTRIINTSVCNGCWNKLEYVFDRGDWDWCPVHKGTERQFECHKLITSEMVIEKIQHLIK
jgi:autotransporter strand-loop-strand O-heptosyltransferase